LHIFAVNWISDDHYWIWSFTLFTSLFIGQIHCLIERSGEYGRFLFNRNAWAVSGSSLIVGPKRKLSSFQFVTSSDQPLASATRNCERWFCRKSRNMLQHRALNFVEIFGAPHREGDVIKIFGKCEMKPRRHSGTFLQVVMRAFSVAISQIIYLETFIDRPTSEAFVRTTVLLFPPETLKMHIFSGSLFRNPSF
jgi:hypothetical protein